jgi:Ca2+-binding EF-hand superfamily protein
MDPRELRSALQAAGLDMDIDANKRAATSGPLDFADFATLALRRMDPNCLGQLPAATLRSVRRVFDKFDADRSGADAWGCRRRGSRARVGSMDARELRAAMRAMDVELSAEDAAATLRSAGKSESQALDFAVRISLSRASLTTSPPPGLRGGHGGADGQGGPRRLSVRNTRGALSSAAIAASPRSDPQPSSVAARCGRRHRQRVDRRGLQGRCRAAAAAAARVQSLRHQQDRHGLRAGADAISECRVLMVSPRPAGSMDARDFRAAMQALGVELTPEEARRMVTAADRDGSGKLEFGEFAALVLPKLSGGGGGAAAGSGLEKLSAAQLRSIKQVFEKFDADRSGQPHDACAPPDETDAHGAPCRRHH